MNIRKLSPSQILLTAAGATLGIGTLWLLTLLIFGRPTSRSDFWAMAEGLSAAMAFAAVVGGGLVALSQIVESVDNRNLEVFDRIFMRWMSEEQLAARRYIYQYLPDDPAEWYETCTSEDREKVRLILNAFDYLGFLISQHWITDESIAIWVNPIVVRVWSKVGHYVEYDKRIRGKGEDYYENAVWLAQKCLAWRERANLHIDPPYAGE